MAGRSDGPSRLSYRGDATSPDHDAHRSFDAGREQIIMSLPAPGGLAGV